jgi:N-ethylmaleimide reductase
MAPTPICSTHFCATGPNLRNRARLLLEVAKACADAIGADRLGARITIPFDYSVLNDCLDGVWMVNNGYDRTIAINAVANGRSGVGSGGAHARKTPRSTR